MNRCFVAFVCALILGLPAVSRTWQTPGKVEDIGAKVPRFFAQHRFGWRDMNVPESDGRLLHDLVIKNGYKRALEIGTSTGHSGIWTAWYTNYARAVVPRLRVGGCLTAHNVSPSRWRSITGNFSEYITSLPFLETSVTQSGISISYKRREQQ